MLSCGRSGGVPPLPVNILPLSYHTLLYLQQRKLHLLVSDRLWLFPLPMIRFSLIHFELIIWFELTFVLCESPWEIEGNSKGLNRRLYGALQWPIHLSFKTSLQFELEYLLLKVGKTQCCILKIIQWDDCNLIYLIKSTTDLQGSFGILDSTYEMKMNFSLILALLIPNK